MSLASSAWSPAVLASLAIGLFIVGGVVGGLLRPLLDQSIRRFTHGKAGAWDGSDRWTDLLVGENKGRQEFKQWPYKKLDLPKSVTSLKGVPEGVTHVVVRNAALVSVEGLPTSVRQVELYECRGSLRNLRGLPRSLKRIRIEGSVCLESLEGLPKGVEIVACGNLARLKSFRGLPTTTKVLICFDCAVENLIGIPSGATFITESGSGSPMDSIRATNRYFDENVSQGPDACPF